MATAQEAAIGFARQLHKEDQAEVIDFDSRVRVLQTFTNDAAALEKAIRKTTAGGSTSLYNAHLHRAEGSEEGQGGVDVGHPPPGDRPALGRRRHVEPAAVRRGARSRQALRDGDLRDRPARRERSARREFKEAEFVLRQLSQETGGRAFFPTDARELPKIYQAISDELSSQYTVGYSSGNPKRDGAWRRVVVRVTAAGLTARHQAGLLRADRLIAVP